MQNMTILKLKHSGESIDSLCTTEEAISAAISEISRLVEVERKFNIMALHMAEVKAIVDGGKENTLSGVVEHCLEEIEDSSHHVRPQRLRAKGSM